MTALKAPPAVGVPCSLIVSWFRLAVTPGGTEGPTALVLAPAAFRRHGVYPQSSPRGQPRSTWPLGVPGGGYPSPRATRHCVRVMRGTIEAVRSASSRAGRGETDITSRLCARLLGLAEKFGDAGLRLQAHHAIWSTSFVCGAPAKARAHAESGLALFDPEIHQSMASSYGNHDAGNQDGNSETRQSAPRSAEGIGHRGAQAFRSRSAAAVSVSSFLAKQNRRTGPPVSL